MEISEAGAVLALAAMAAGLMAVWFRLRAMPRAELRGFVAMSVASAVVGIGVFPLARWMVLEHFAVQGFLWELFR